MFSPTGYYAHYRTQYRSDDRERGTHWIDTLPIIGYTDTALVISESGDVKTVNALRDELAEGGDTPDIDGQTYTVSLSVTTHDGEATG